MKHRMAVAGALAIGVMIAFLMVGRARAAEPAAGWWTLGPDETVRHQLSGKVGRSGNATVRDVGLSIASHDTVAARQAEGRNVPCCLEAGSWEPDRPDTGRTMTSVEGTIVEEWGDERRLDVHWLPTTW